MCKYYGYIRVSTSEKAAKQTYERQQYLLENSGIEFDEIFEEHISGGVRGNQREMFNKMLASLQPTDVVCFTETSRFGRNYIDCFEMLDIITQQYGATVKFLSNGIELKGGEKMNPYTWLTVSNFFIMDEFQKRQIGYNTKNALAKKIADGVKLGRPEVSTVEQQAEIVELRLSGLTIRQIAAKMEMPTTNIVRILKKENQ